jgi:hypothetical protein
VRVPQLAAVLVTLVAALVGITGVHVDWADSKGLNQWERKVLEPPEERSRLGYGSASRWRTVLGRDKKLKEATAPKLCLTGSTIIGRP